MRFSPAREAHPFTPFAIAWSVCVLASLLPEPAGPLWLFAAVAALVVGAGVPLALRDGVAVCLPLWFFLLLIHGALAPARELVVGPLTLSRPGVAEAAAQAGRLGAILTASFAVYRAFDPSRFLDAVAARGWSFAAAYVLVATLQAAPRLGDRARAILDAQRARGLSYRGSPIRKLRALPPLTLPLVLSTLTEVDERAMALETRGMAAGARRTPLSAPSDRAVDRIARGVAYGSVLAALAWRLLR